MSTSANAPKFSILAEDTRVAETWGKKKTPGEEEDEDANETRKRSPNTSDEQTFLATRAEETRRKHAEDSLIALASAP